MRVTGRAVVCIGRWVARHHWTWGVGPPIIILVAPYLVANIVTGRRLAHEIALIRASGAPVTLAEAAPSPVPDGKNAAVLYQKAFKLLPSNKQQEQIADFLSRDEKKRTRVRVEKIKRIVARSAPMFRLLEQAAARPACRFPVKWEEGLDARFPHLPQMRAIAKLLAAKAVIEARSGDPGKALNDILLILSVSDSIARDPTMVPHLVRFACQAIAMTGSNRVMETAPPSMAEAHRTHCALRTVDNMRPFTRALEGERCVGIWLFDALRRNPAGAFSLFSDWEAGFGSPRVTRWQRLLARCGMLLWLPFFKQDEVAYLQHMNRIIELSLHSRLERRKDYAAIEGDAPAIPSYALLTRILSPVYARSGMARDRGMAWLGVAQWGMALRAYQVQVGRYPDSLAQLRERIKWALPVDPFSGKDFIYRKRGAGYLLYSIGQNMKDDGGLDYWAYKGPPRKEPPDDIAWRMSH